MHKGFSSHGMNLTSFLLTSQTFVHGVFQVRDDREVATLWGPRVC